VDRPVTGDQFRPGDFLTRPFRSPPRRGWPNLFIMPVYTVPEGMHKEELITLHQMMVEIKDYFERINPELKFTQYYALKIDPSQLHRSKMEHKYAIFVLGAELANAMRDVEFSASGRISARMKELADRTLKEIDSMK
jgi:hypothetical protein